MNKHDEHPTKANHAATWAVAVIACIGLQPGCADILGIPETTLSDALAPPSDDPDAGEPMIDATVISCTPGETYCNGHVLETCNAGGTGPDMGMSQACDLACVDDSTCVTASNRGEFDFAGCDNTAAALEPPANSSVTFRDNGGTITIQCSDGCDGGLNSIDSTAIDVNRQVAWFCLSRLDIPDTVRVTHDGQVDPAIILFVHTTANIAGDIDLAGKNGGSADGGIGGAGAGRGANASNGGGNNGVGECRGDGGNRAIDFQLASGTGGAGGGNRGSGGGGGSASADNGVGGSDQRSGASRSSSGCGTDEIVPLEGGSGGGGGGDGTSCNNCGYPGGGGGGAIQITARQAIMLTGTGTINASGGNGFGVSNTRGGGGGGGSGGAILLESLEVAMTGALSVEGGNGGDAIAGDGGDGAGDDSLDGDDGSGHDNSNESGAGGGGGSGYIRINSIDGNGCVGAITPMDACTAGVVR